MKISTNIRDVLAIFGVLFLMILMGTRLFPADQTKYDLTENQKLRLQVKQKDAQLAQMQVSIANAQFQKTIDDFNAEVKIIEKENSWPETLQINPQNLTFSEAPAPVHDKPVQSEPPKTPEIKPDPATKIPKGNPKVSQPNAIELNDPK